MKYLDKAWQYYNYAKSKRKAIEKEMYIYVEEIFDSVVSIALYAYSQKQIKGSKFAAIKNLRKLIEEVNSFVSQSDQFLMALVEFEILQLLLKSESNDSDEEFVKEGSEIVKIFKRISPLNDSDYFSCQMQISW